LNIPSFTGGRREIVIICPSCEFRSTVPPAAIARNSYFCSRCGKPVDLLKQTYRPEGSSGDGAYAAPRRDKNTSRYKSARKGRR
jgi:uncharacterized paraquat-inducible protein A